MAHTKNLSLNSARTLSIFCPTKPRARLVISLLRIGLLTLAAGVYSQVGAQSAEFTQNTKGTNAMTIEVPLGNYPGRGISLPVTLRYSTSGLWRIGFINSTYENVSGFQVLQPNAEAIYAEHSTAGWKTSLDVPEIEWPKQNDRYWYTGKPYAIGYVSGSTYRIARVFVHMPDGSTHELRRSDQLYQDTNVVEMNGTFYAVDDSRMRYDGNSNGTGTLYMTDGSRYILNGGTTQYIDRNGNTLSYNATNQQWIDTMGRVIGMPWPANPGAGDYTYSVPGFAQSTSYNSQVTITYTLKFRNLSDVFLPDVANQTLKPMSDYYLPIPYATPSPGNLPQGPLAAGSTLFAGGWADPDDQSNAHDFTYVVGRGQSGSANFNPVVLSEIDLPNGQSYRFSYNAYGELDKVIYPTGGYERYAYAQVTTTNGSPAIPYDQGTRGMLSRWLSPSGSGNDEAHWTYSASTYPLSVTAPDGTRSDTYLSVPQNSQSNNFGYQDARAGLPFEERIYSPGGTMLRRTLIDYAQSSAPFNRPSPATGQYTAYRNPHPIKTVNLMLDTGGDALASITTNGYDANYPFTFGLDQTSTSEYKYAVVNQTTAQTAAITSFTPDPSLLVRTTQVAYLTTDANYNSRNILGLPTSTTVTDAANTVVAQTSVTYDETSLPLLTYGNVTGWIDPGTNYRGNVTTSSRWLNYPTATWLATHAQYDQCGSVRKSWDARDASLLNPAQIEYSSQYAYAFPTQTISPIPDSNGSFGSNTSLTGTSVYDFNTGLVISTTDANSQTTTCEYSDPLNRPTRVNLPDGGSTRHVYAQDSHGNYIETFTRLDANRETSSRQYVDGLGRASRSFGYENQDPNNPYLTVDTIYDSMGRVSQVSSPYRSAGYDSTPNQSGNWTTTVYDDLGRVHFVTTPDNAQVTTAYGALTTGNYVGPTVTVTDQALKSRESVTDAQGRLIKVIEDPGSAAYETNYTYDVLGNLRKVDQGGQLRFFMHDSLGRLLRSRNPEQDANSALNLTDPITGNGGWSMGYGYDNNGNITTRVDARNVTTTYGYDALNRGTTAHYTDGTKDIERHYDNPTAGKNGIGKFWYANWAADNIRFDSHVAIDEYDAMGRPKNYRQRFFINGASSPDFVETLTYNLAGQTVAQGYPSGPGHSVSYNYDIAGRLNSYTGTIGDGTQHTYTSGITYSPFGGQSQEQFGTTTAVYNKSFYNNRGLMNEVRVGWTPNNDSWDLGAILNVYSGAPADGWTGSGTDNNGDLRKQMVYIPGSSFMPTTFFYHYDSLNRIDKAQEATGSNTPWVQQFDYDRWGNRTINQGATTGGVNNQQFAVDTGSNRLYAPNDSSHTLIDYDAAGNQKLDNYTGGGQRTYDAENHLISAQNLDHTWSYYTYDFNGRRIKRKINGAETWMLYGMGGELLAEYATDDSPGTPLREYGYRNGQLLIVAESGTAAAPGPTGFSAAPYNDSGVAKVTLSWTALSGAVNYRVERAASKDGPYEFAGVSSSNSLIDGGVSPGSAHLYKVCAANGSNNCTSAYSNIALGVAVIFTDPDIKGFSDDPSGQTVTTIKAAHVTELRSTVNAVRHLVPGMPDGSWTNQTLTPQVSLINVEDVRDLRTNLDAALQQLGIDTPAYQEDPTLVGFHENPLTATPIKAKHIRELRTRATSGHGGSGGGAPTASVHWLVADQLGTPRMILDQSGSLSGVSRHDYLPFGEELTLNGRNSSNGYSGDNTRQRFTGYEADGETGLNFAEARYQSNVQGRFTSVDPLMASASVTNPQSLNRYTYVQNNPTNFTDPTGMMLSDIGVYQTANPECARLIERAEDQGVKNWVAGRSTISSASSLSTRLRQNFVRNQLAKIAKASKLSQYVPPSYQGSRLPGSETPIHRGIAAYNCMAAALGIHNRWVQAGNAGTPGPIFEVDLSGPGDELTRVVEGEYSNSDVPEFYGASRLKEGQVCQSGTYQIRYFKDTGKGDNWHVMYQELDGTWTSKNGDGSLYFNILDANIFDRLAYPPHGRVLTTDYCMPRRQ